MRIAVGLGLDWLGLDWIGLDWIGLDWIGLALALALAERPMFKRKVPGYDSTALTESTKH